jgi:hypothetical protein
MRDSITVYTGAGCSAILSWPRSRPGTVEIRILNPDGVEIRRSRGPWRREAILRTTLEIRSAVWTAMRTGLCPPWATGFAPVREAGRKPAVGSAP